MPTRRELLFAVGSMACGSAARSGWVGGFALGGSSLAACSGSRGRTGPSEPAYAPLKLDPVHELVSAAGLRWLVEVKPRAVTGNADLIPAVQLLFPENRFDAFSARYGGIDLRQATDLVVAGYADTTLSIVRTGLDPALVEAAFGRRASHVDGRAVDRARDGSGTELWPIVRTWGTVGGRRQQLAVFGRGAAALESGRLGPLKVAELFAQARLKRAAPALRTAPLAEAAQEAGPAPLRAFACGPFEGDTAQGFGGLLAASTAAVLTVRPLDGGTDLETRLRLLGAWGENAGEASARLAAWFDLFAETPLGRLSRGRTAAPKADVSFTETMLTLEVRVNAMALARGLNAATTARVDEMMAY